MIRNALSVIALTLFITVAGHAADKKVVFLPGTPSHGYGSHEHRAGCMLLADQLNKANVGVKAVVNDGFGYPSDPSILDDADCVVVFCDGGGRHLLNKHLAEFDKIMRKGVGLVCIHYGVETVKGDEGDHFLKWMGGYFEPHWSVNPHWKAEYAQLPDHPITNGVKPFAVHDEWYYHMRFVPQMDNVQPILTALPPESTLRRKDGPHSGNPHVRKAVLEEKNPQHMAWAYQRGEDYNHGRGFGFTGGHFHWNWGHDMHRRVVLNAIVWAAKADVPKTGVPLTPVTAEDLAKNQDYDKPNNFNLDKIQQQINEWNNTDIKLEGKSGQSGAASNAPSGKGAKPVFESKVVSASTKGNAVDIAADIKGAKELYLVVTDAGDGFGCDWADWAEPRLVTADGKETKLTDLKWKQAEAGWGQVRVNQNAGGQSMKIDGKDVAYGIGVHANSVVAYDLPKDHDFVKFVARGGVDNGGTSQGCGSTVAFLVYTANPGAAVLAAGPKAKGGSGGRDAAETLEALDVHPELDAHLFAAEPQLLSPSNIDIDHAGRVWVCEIVNYRKHRGKRPEGDRILILSDTDGDGKVDAEQVFYQGSDIDSPHGVCVLATPDFKNTQVIVSAGETVYVFTDKDGDGKADDKRILFQKIGGTQHDHGIHAFVFGPDGKLYFNFGNSGKQILDASGKIVIDKAGNEVKTNRNPYQQGMVFRCNLDGSEFESLGWNFRNNWMVTVDSFGGMWQSDNDDDGNKGVRINYVMDFGNYGYKDELTGAGWRDKRTNMEAEVPLRHWHLNDPGVVPNLLQTGAGSPTGITVYEGSLLPESFHNEVIHTDAGPNVCRAYPTVDDGAGYKADIINILVGARDKWFRPADVSVAPDGSLIVADWYDPGVGGHNMGDLDRGRLFRVTPKNHSGYSVPKFDFASADGAIEALKNPNYAVRYVAWQALHNMAGGGGAKEALTKMAADANPVYRARALWLLAHLDSKVKGHASNTVAVAAADKDHRIRCQALRMARQHADVDTLKVVAKLVDDPNAQVRRECAVALRFNGSDQANELWAKLAAQHDGKDRWYLEALGIGADLHAEARFEAWKKLVGDKWNTPAGRDIVWRSRAKAALPYLAEIAKDAGADAQPRYMRAFDFHPDSPEKKKALQSLLGL